MLFDWHAYNPHTQRDDRLPLDGNIVKGNLCPEADASQPFWDLIELPQASHDESPPVDQSPTFWRDMTHNLWANSTINPGRTSPAHPPTPKADAPEPRTDALQCPLVLTPEATPREDSFEPQPDSLQCLSPTRLQIRALDHLADEPSSLDISSPMFECDPSSDEEDNTRQTELSRHSSPSPDAAPGEWEASQIVGEEVKDNETHYWVNWQPTLEPERNLGHMADLIADWKERAARSRPRAQRPRKIRIKLQTQPSVPQKVAKRGRGRPRKQISE